MVGVSGSHANDVTISPCQAFVMVMASRNGYGQVVSEIIKEKIEKLVNNKSEILLSDQK